MPEEAEQLLADPSFGPSQERGFDGASIMKTAQIIGVKMQDLRYVSSVGNLRKGSEWRFGALQCWPEQDQINKLTAVLVGAFSLDMFRSAQWRRK